MTVQTIMAELKAKGNDGVKKIFLKHGILEPFFGVKIEYLKAIQKKVKKDYQLAKDLYATGNADAMYLAGLIADEAKMTKKDLTLWVTQAKSTNISDYTVPWIAAESHHGYELAMEWIQSKIQHVAAAGWATLSSLVSIKPDTDLNTTELKKLLSHIETNIQKVPDQVRAKMNGFIIALGSFVPALTNDALTTAKKIGTITIIKEGTACKTPDATTYINKVKNKGTLGKKKKMARC
ncbi:MAG TPA: DNA alkylation repair protein [Bacteroidia bacterium]|nr:DNA alkylation repair protein [Bacteroidia bacterium]